MDGDGVKEVPGRCGKECLTPTLSQGTGRESRLRPLTLTQGTGRGSSAVVRRRGPLSRLLEIRLPRELAQQPLQE